MESADHTIISKELLEVLACPKCRAEIHLVQYSGEKHGLKCNTCELIYPIRDGIPVMLIDEALPLT